MIKVKGNLAAGEGKEKEESFIGKRRRQDRSKPPEGDKEKLLRELLELAERMEIRVIQSREAEMIQGGATGRLRDQNLIVLNPRAGLERKLEVIVQALKKVDWEGMYLKPEIRGLLEGGKSEED